MSLKVSVIIPCYNVENFIFECIDSVVAQTYRNVEIICIDNNSTDTTLHKLYELQRKYSSLLVDAEKSPGSNAARNKGLSIAQGDWIQFLDADDLLEPDKIEHQVSLLSRNQDPNLAFIAAAHKKRPLVGKEEIISNLSDVKYISAYLNRCGNTCSNLWDRKKLVHVGQWNQEIRSSQETDLMFRLILAGYNYSIDLSPLTIIRERESGQISQSNPVGRWKQYIDVRLKYINELKKNEPTAYKTHKGVLHDFLIVSLITLSRYDINMANEYYKKFIMPEWVSANQFGLSPVKVKLIKWFGFKSLLPFLNK